MKWLSGSKRSYSASAVAEPPHMLAPEPLASMHASQDAYLSASPFPHTVIDSFLPPSSLRLLLDHYPADQSDPGWNNATHTHRDVEGYVQKDKRNMRDLRKMPWPYRQLIWELNSHAFLSELSALTGIPHLLPDPLLRGGGIHQIGTGGYLKIHADFTHHREYDLDRRLNLLIYLNEDWQEAWGGHLELWDPDLKGPPTRIAPIANRCVIFSTTSSTFHGHPHPLECPPNVFRKSVALYYYTNGRPQSEANRVVSTDWKEV